LNQILLGANDSDFGWWMPQFVKVAAAKDVAPGQGKVVEAGGREIALFNVGGTFHAIDNTCKHRGGSLGEGELDGTVVTCPLHAWTYDVTSGECFDDPACGIQTFPVKIEGDDVLIEI
jgi:nitrite reductase/ring-hydroxylating ferredoxin subunit